MYLLWVVTTILSESLLFLTQTYISISSFTLRDTKSREIDKKRQRKSNSIRKTPSGRIPTSCAGNWRRNTWIPQITSTISWTHKTHHTKGNKRRNRTLKCEKSTWHGLNNSKNAKGITRKGHDPTHLFNAIIGHQYWPHKLKLAEIILIPKPGKNPKEVKSYRPISLLPIIAKLLEKLVLRRIDPDFATSDWIPRHQFGFRLAHSTIQQCHRLTHTIIKALNNKGHCTSVFLDISQAFDKV